MSVKLISSWMLMLMTIIPITINGLSLRIRGHMWSRWTNEQIKAEDGKDKFSKNYFSLERGNLTLEPTFTPNIRGRFTVDMFSCEESIDGAGLKVRRAFVDFANLFPVPETNLTVGLQSVYFGTIYDWGYDLIGKSLPGEYVDVIESSDYGVTVNGYIPGGLGEYAFGMYNGEGYKKTGESLSDNISFAYLANVRLTPLAGVTIGGSYMTNSFNREKTLDSDEPNPEYGESVLLSGLLRLNYGIVDFWAEYISNAMAFPNVVGEDYTAKGFKLMPILSLQSIIGPDIQFIARYDRWDNSDNPSLSYQSLLNATTLGVNYNFLHDGSNVPNMQLQLNYTVNTYDENKSAPSFADGAEDSNLLMLQLKWLYSASI